MVLGKIIGRVLPKIVAANSTTATRIVSGTVAADSAAAARKAIAEARKAANPFDYGRKIFTLPEGQVTTRSGKVYTRTIGSSGERIYTDANGYQTAFCGLIYNNPGFNESAIFRSLPSVGYSYSLRFSTSNLRYNRGKQIVTRHIRDRVGGNMHHTSIEISPQGRVKETRYDNYIGATCKSNGIATRYGCPTAWSHNDVYGWLKMRGVTETPPLWTSLSDYIK